MRKRILGNRGLSGILEFLLRFLFILGIVVTAALPVSLWSSRGSFRLVRGVTFRAGDVQVFFFVFIFGVLMTIFVYQAAKIFRTINQNNPFVEGNVRALGAIAVLSILISVDCFVFAFFDQSIFAGVFGFVFLFLWGLFLVLRELFRSALEYKQENDFTV